jgi:flavin reductase (DIM6/NTAB) family NADH-FMN oxidoreductase RutF
MEKVEADISMICYPMPCSLIGTKVGGKVNFMTVAWFSQVSLKPPYILAALSKNHFTNAGIKETGAFSVNIPSTSMAEVTDYCGLVSGKKFDKSTVFEVFYGKEGKAPMIVECPYNLECKLVQTVDLQADELIIGEIVAAYLDERCLTDGVPDMAKVDPLILNAPQMTYLGVGTRVGNAFNMGKSLIKKD